MLDHFCNLDFHPSKENYSFITHQCALLSLIFSNKVGQDSSEGQVKMH